MGDFRRLYRWTQHDALFLTRARRDVRFTRLSAHPVDTSTGVQCDQTIARVWLYPAPGYPDRLRRIRYRDADRQQRLVFVTNSFTLPPLSVAELSRCRWRVELFFKWITQHRILSVSPFVKTPMDAAFFATHRLHEEAGAYKQLNLLDF